MKNTLRPNHTCLIEFRTYVTLILLKNSCFSSAVETTPPSPPPPPVDSSVNIRAVVTRAISSIARKAKGARQQDGGRGKLKKLRRTEPKDVHLEEDAK